MSASGVQIPNYTPHHTGMVSELIGIIWEQIYFGPLENVLRQTTIKSCANRRAPAPG